MSSTPTKPLAALAALTIALAATVAPAFARDGYVVDDAHLLKPDTVSRINQQVGDFHAQSGKEVLFVSTPSLSGQSLAAAEERAFAQQQVNGVMIFVAKAEHKIGVVPDRAGSRFFPPGSTDTIRQAIAAQYKTGDFDGGTLTGVGLVVNMYRSHLGSRVRQHAYQPVGSSNVSRSNAGGFNMGWIWWIIILAVIFFVIRGIFRAMAGPRMMPPGYGGGPMGGGGGYGPGYGGGMGGGGGGFFSGLLGGLGGAFLGNELFGNRGGGGFGGGNEAGFGGDGGAADNSGFQSDAGQADMGNASSGDFGGGGDSGGGWGGGGGGGDWGGGGGDSGGGGGGDW